MSNESTNPTSARRRPWIPAALGTRLFVFIVAAIALTAVLQGFLAYGNALSQADTLFDYQMQRTAYALRAGLPVDAKGQPQGTPPEEENNDFIVQVWTNEGLRIFESALGTSLPQMAVLGFANVPARDTSYRVFSLQTRSQVIQIAQDISVRQTLARAAAWRSLLPIALLAPILAFAAWWLIRVSLAPVQRVQREVAARKPQALEPLSLGHLPEELQPLVGEFNALLQRMDEAFAIQQQFVADAAHELRSPLAALQLQLQLLERAETADARQQAMHKLAGGIERATRLVQQLLTLARQDAQPSTHDSDKSTTLPWVDVSALAMQCMADLAELAHSRQLDLGLTEPCDGARHLWVRGDAAALQSLVSNLLENAIKHTPPGTQIDLGWQTGTQHSRLVIEDSGPGIAQADRQRVLQRFVRGSTAASQSSGTGLGLAIAQAIALRHHAHLELASSPHLGGLQASIIWPADYCKGAMPEE